MERMNTSYLLSCKHVPSWSKMYAMYALNTQQRTTMYALNTQQASWALWTTYIVQTCHSESS